MLNFEEGKWDDQNCNKKDLVVCQKYQIWTPALIQQTLLKERKQLQDIQNQLNSEIASLKDSVSKTIPVGFAYVQLPKEKAPQDIWPQFKWADVSATYAGVFFRVLGGGAGAFGAVQEDDNPRLTHIALSNANGYKDAGDPIAKGAFGKIKAGSTGTLLYFQFDVSKTEVRPRNMAVKVWQRTG